MEDKYTLYGFYYANQSWASVSNASKWNITAAYNQFDTAVNATNATGFQGGSLGALPLWIYSNNTGYSFGQRFYDEDACVIECYLIFYSLLNVTDGLNKALYWWDWVQTWHWSNTYQVFTYDGSIPNKVLECESPFFLKIMSMLKYYSPTMLNYTRVLTDIGTRYLSNLWDSYQWVDSGTNITSYAIQHAYAMGASGVNQRRLQNTLGAWQALFGAYVYFNSTYQNNMYNMLYGNSTVEPAWALLLTPDTASSGPYTGTGAGLFYLPQIAFSLSSADAGYSWTNNNNATAMGETLLFMMGIVPGSSTIAFPLEELSYEYLNDIDPYLLAFNLTVSMQKISVPVVRGGTLTFQYGASPITVNFASSGVYEIVFSQSWSNVLTVTKMGSLLNNVIYFYTVSPAVSGYGLTSTAVNSTTTLYVHWYEQGILSSFIVGTNNTGQMVNVTWSDGLYRNSNATLGWGASNADGNYTFTLNASATVLQCIEYANDTAGTWATTGILTFSLTISVNYTVTTSMTTGSVWTELIIGTFKVSSSYSTGDSWIKSLKDAWKISPSFSTLETYTINGKTCWIITRQFITGESYVSQEKTAFKTASSFSTLSSFTENGRTAFKISSNLSTLDQYITAAHSGLHAYSSISQGDSWSTFLFQMRIIYVPTGNGTTSTPWGTSELPTTFFPGWSPPTFIQPIIPPVVSNLLLYIKWPDGFAVLGSLIIVIFVAGWIAHSEHDRRKRGLRTESEAWYRHLWK